MLKIKSNIHSHTKYCNHSDIEPKWLIKKAKEEGFKQFTISEHIPYPKTLVNRTRFEEWDTIFKEFLNLKKEYETDDFKIFLALEIEYHKDDKQYYIDFFNKYDLDFLIFGNHNYGSVFNEIEYKILNDPNQIIEKYVEQTISGFESKLFFHFAHPDFIVYHLKTWNDHIALWFQKLIDKAIEHNITLGFNVNGYYAIKNNKFSLDEYYPYENFWRLVAKTNAKVRIEVDIHIAKMFYEEIINETYDLAIKWGLENNLVDEITEEELMRAKLLRNKQ